MLNFYGIKNCNSVKKSQEFLKNEKIEFEFFDIKKLDEKTFDFWIGQRNIIDFVNTAGITAKKIGLNKEKLTYLSKDELKQVILNNLSCIKRPVIEFQGKIYIGKEYESLK
ncbi:ArsC/Spx/MgsR family protein [Campylobacter molothri]|uniref:ArsC/Spx/MgsR family protein n=1 Tax=Campylobacter molothri TaxID=1032242 RepID=UPI0035B090D8